MSDNAGQARNEDRPDYWSELLAEHKIESAPRPDGGWDWSCSCGEKGQSADCRDHWADLMMRGLWDTEFRHSGAVIQRTPKRRQMLREVILAGIDETLRSREYKRILEKID